MQNNEELLEQIGETFLWEVVSDHVEHDYDHIKEALRKIGRIPQENVEKIAWAEIQNSDEFIINGYESENGLLKVSFEMPALIHTKSSSNEWLFHITTWCTGTVRIPDAEHFAWNTLDFDKMNRLELLAHKDLARDIHVVYEEQDTEADDLTALHW